MSPSPYPPFPPGRIGRRRGPGRFVGLGLLLIALPAAGVTHRVPEDHPTVGAALALSVSGDEVVVGAGVWSVSSGETFPLVIPDGVHLHGVDADSSVLDAQGTAAVVVLPGSSRARLTDLTLTGGAGDWGGGVAIQAGTHEVARNRILANGALRRGSGIDVSGDASPWIHHNVICANFDLDLIDSGDPHGIQCGGSSRAVVEHNLVGRTDSNGLFVLETAAPIIRHNIFFENGIPGWRGRGICFFGGAQTQIHHNLFHANAISAMVLRDANGVLTDATAAAASALIPGDGIYDNLDGDPLLWDIDNLDFRLRPGSPAIDAGDSTLPGDPDGSVADLGPFPFEPTAVDAPRPINAQRLHSARVVPNPFNPATEVVFALEVSSRVRVTVLDARGRRVLDDDMGILEPGDRRWFFDGRDQRGRPLASGVYRVVIRGAGTAVIARAVLVR